MACVLVLNCLLLILLNIFLTVSASRSPLPRYVVGEDVQHAIFGSSVFDPIKHIFEVNMTEKHNETAATGSTKSPGVETTKETLRISKDSNDTENVKEPWRKHFKFLKEFLRVRTNTSDVTDATTLETIVATVSSTNPETVTKMTNEANVVEPVTRVKVFTPVDEDDSSKLKEQTYDNTITQTKIEPVEAYEENLSKQEPQDDHKKNYPFDAFVTPETVNKITNEANVVEPIPKVKLFKPVGEDISSKLKEQTYDKKITQKKIEPIEAYTENLLKQEPHDDNKKNETKLVGQQSRRTRGRGDYDSREVNEFPF